ncbi:MAG: AAA family ATPase, partial [Spirochaetes bacterium]|nr:AAA family ATPase [Spirochaetota bacterium]
VDFVLASPGKIIAVEVKSSRMRNPRGLKKFLELYPSARPLIIGEGGIELKEFFSSSLEDILGRYA